MRNVIDDQIKIGETSIKDIQFDLNSRDEIPQILMGLQHIYSNKDLRKSVFDILEDLTPEGIDPKNGRNGMSYWKILVLGTLRLGCNIDYDKLKEIADQHNTVREMLGYLIYLDEEKFYPLQTVKDNVSLLTPEVMDQVNQEVVKYGHSLLGKTVLDTLNASCDSFVVETNVHFPTDINLLLDAIGKVIPLMGLVCKSAGISDWRQSNHNKKKVKRLYRITQQLKRSNSKNPQKKAEKEKKIQEAYLAYLDLCANFLCKAEWTIQKIRNDSAIGGVFTELQLMTIESYMAHASRQIEQTHRRVIQGEKIPHDEKVFSIFEEHTEWISKGKAGVPQELGLKVCILQDQYGFICHHKVMRAQVDNEVAISMIFETQSRFPNLASCSFDKGFYSPVVKEVLPLLLDQVVLPKKGKMNEEEKRNTQTEDYIKARRKHSAVESAINALEHHGLDRCPDKGINGFMRYVSLSILSRNIHILGCIIQQKEKEKQKLKAA